MIVVAVIISREYYFDKKCRLSILVWFFDHVLNVLLHKILAIERECYVEIECYSGKVNFWVPILFGKERSGMQESFHEA